MLFFKSHFKKCVVCFPHTHNAPDHTSEHLNFNPTSSCPIRSWGGLDTTLLHHSISHHKIFLKRLLSSYESTDGQQCIDFILAIRGSLVLLLRRMCSIDFVVFLYMSFKLNVLLFLLVLMFALEFFTIHSPQLYLHICDQRVTGFFLKAHAQYTVRIFPIHFFKIKCSVISPRFTICTPIFEKGRKKKT